MPGKVAIGLLLTDGLGPKRLNTFLNRLKESETDLQWLYEFSIEDLESHPEFNRDRATEFLSLKDRSTALSETLEEFGAIVIATSDDKYSPLLRERLPEKTPAFLFVRGNAELLLAPAISIGGSRNASDLALRATADAVSAIVATGRVVVSGGARGVDLAAHEAALAAGGRTVVVLPQGLLTYSPPASIARGLDEGRVAIVSEFPPDLPWSTYAAMQRNRTVVGLGEAFLIAEAGTSGGTKAAADGALAARVPTGVLAFPHGSMPDGNQALITRGGMPIPVDDQGCVDRNALAALPTSPASPPAPTQPLLF